MLFKNTFINLVVAASAIAGPPNLSRQEPVTNLVTFCFSEGLCFQESVNLEIGCVDLPEFNEPIETASLSATGGLTRNTESPIVKEDRAPPLSANRWLNLYPFLKRAKPLQKMLPLLSPTAAYPYPLVQIPRKLPRTCRISPKSLRATKTANLTEVNSQNVGPFLPTTNPANAPDTPVPSTTGGPTAATPAVSRKQQKMLVQTEREKTVEASPKKRRILNCNQPPGSPTRRGSGVGTQLAPSDDEFSPGIHGRPTTGSNSDIDMSPRTSSAAALLPPRLPALDRRWMGKMDQLDRLTTLLGNHNVGNVAQILAAIQTQPASLKNPLDAGDTQTPMSVPSPTGPDQFDGMTLPPYDLAIKVDPYIASTRPNGPKEAAVLAESFVEKLSALNISMNDGTWERFLRNTPWLYEGFPEEQRCLIAENTTRWILVIPFNGGSTLNEKVPKHGHQTMKLLEDLGNTVEHTITPTLQMPRPAGQQTLLEAKVKAKNQNPPAKGAVDKYAPPRTSAYKLHDIQDVLRLEALQTVDINPGIAVHFVRASLMQRSHFVCCIRVDQLRLSPKIINTHHVHSQVWSLVYE
ncbi:hypothetical protein BDP27DRAFT_1428020 [Rhodocollybia butyracea]|uniref:Uncharacterized protein n=1 Tax=Rhodocollybia butyracea TaxID=206335 RepID=A0A9P5PHR1_9AGAR|nr:hypothetical protein BDP27DRAFT_1428020 [Rhodocollybia butyracea]